MLEQHADWGRAGDVALVVSQFAGFLVDLEDGERVGVLTGSDQPTTVRRQIDVAGCCSSDVFSFYKGQFAGLLIDAENGDGVVASVGGVDESAAGVDSDF